MRTNRIALIVAPVATVGLMCVALVLAGEPNRLRVPPSIPAATAGESIEVGQPVEHHRAQLTAHADDAGPFPTPPGLRNPDLIKQSSEQAMRKSWGCINCHQGIEDMHNNTDRVHLGCCDCHGGDPTATDKNKAHIHPRFPEAWTSSANPVRSYALLNHESPEFIRFVNPGDLRIAHMSCGNCHAQEILEVRKSMMTHGCMLWGSALYNNGAVPQKRPQYGEAYSMHGKPLRLQTVPPPTEEEMAKKGVLPHLDPLPRFEITQPGNVLRIFERGGRFKLQPGIPEVLEEPGRPRARLSNRGLGTLNRTDPVFIGLQKTRLLDPTLNFLGTNDHPGDYRSSGCSACHVVYANSGSPVHSAGYAKFGNRGTSFSPDPTIPKDEPGHPIAHKFSLSIPTSQCIVCHVHPGTNVLNSFLGYMWWDNETDGELMYPPQQRQPTAEQFAQAQMSNPNDAAARGLWSDPEFLANVSELNPHLRHTQFADFHGHGWVFRAVYKKDRKGNLLDYKGDVVQDVTTEKLMRAMDPPTMEEKAHGKAREDTPLHYMDIHLEKGMHCVDCHFRQDNHGNTKLYGEVRAAIEIKCVDCHGSYRKPATLRTSGPAAPEFKSAKQPGQITRGTNLLALRTPWGKPRFEVRGNRVIQRSMVEKDLSWEIVQTANTVDPRHEHYNAKSALAKTVRFSNDNSKLVWGDWPDPAVEKNLCAHSSNNTSCIACHSSWNPSCFGCHLPQKANVKSPSLHFEGDVSRNRVSYNFQTLRDDVFMLARDGDVTGNRIGPARSSCAIHVGSYNQNRESVYVQQQTISSEGLSGIAFSSNVPHTVRGGPPRKWRHANPEAALAAVGDTKNCTDCHLSDRTDNNALIAQLLMQGTNYTNFVGKYCWVAAGEHGLEAVIVTETEEPQAVIGSTLHRIAYPNNYRKHLQHDSELRHSHEHPGIGIAAQLLGPLGTKPEIKMVQMRGEYVYAACGPAGLKVFDVAMIDNKGFSERIVTAPVSPAGQRFFVRSKYATAVAAPTTMAPDPTRTHLPENREPAIHPLYAYIYVADKYEGLILVNAATLLDGNPTNNFLKRAVTFNPNGLLKGARYVTIVGTYAYVTCDAGLVVISLDKPLEPKVTAVIGEQHLHKPTVVTTQFRYAFVCDEQGVKVFDITDLARPQYRALVELPEAKSIYVARTYAYVAAGPMGLVILDVENPERPRIDQVFDAEGEISDLHDLKLGITNASQFAYLADGKNGLHVVQLTSPETPGNDGFSPRPTPRLIATKKLPDEAEALWISEGIDRDRAVDESGNQIGVFGRIGARPLNLEEQRRMYLRPDGRLYRVSDDPRSPIYFELRR